MTQDLDKTLAQIEKEKADKFKENLSALLSVENGRGFLYSLLDMTGLNAQHFHPENPRIEAYSLGRASFGKELQDKLIETSPENYMLMLKEAENANRRTEHRVRNADSSSVYREHFPTRNELERRDREHD